MGGPHTTRPSCAEISSSRRKGDGREEVGKIHPENAIKILRQVLAWLSRHPAEWERTKPVIP